MCTKGELLVVGKGERGGGTARAKIEVVCVCMSLSPPLFLAANKQGELKEGGGK